MKKHLLVLVLIFFSTATTAQDKFLIGKTLKLNAKKLIEQGLKDEQAYNIVESLTTEIGPRLAGSDAEARARDWAVKLLRKEGFKNVRNERFDLPVWKRGVETAEIISPFPQPMIVTALGGSVTTGDDGVEGEVVRYSELSELEAAPDNSLKGKIVFIDQSMTRTQDGSGYGLAVAKRSKAAFAAYKTGAVAVLIRSVGTSSHRFAHTGQMRAANKELLPSVPAAALSAPDADQLARALKTTNKVTMKVTLTPSTHTVGESGNIIAEIPGSKNKSEIVLLGAHLDSWDLGTGAVDDGAGVGIVIAAAKLIMNHFPKPNRTIRVVLFGSEENGLLGAKAYADQHKNEIEQHVIAAESDFGAGRIWRLDSDVAAEKRSIIKAIHEVISPLGIVFGKAKTNGGPDLYHLHKAGMPVVSLVQNGWDYFDLHHTANDTLDKIEPADLAQNVATYAAFAYLVANIGDDFGRVPIVAE